MRPSASSVARIFRPARKIRTPQPKRSPPPASSSIRRRSTMRSPRRRPRQKRSKAAATPNPGLLVGPGYAHFGRDTSSNVATGQPWPVDDIVPYWDTGGFGGPAGATAGAAGGSAATGANADGGGADAAVDCVETGSEPPLEA